jgi:hypothetical protein
MTVLDRLTPPQRVVTAGVCAGLGIVLPLLLSGRRGGLTPGLVVIAFTYWRIFRGSALAYSIVCVLTAFFGFFLVWATIADSTQHVATTTEAVAAALISVQAAMLWSRSVAKWVGQRRARFVHP